MKPTTCPHCSKDVPTQQLQVSEGCLVQMLFLYTVMILSCILFTLWNEHVQSFHTRTQSDPFRQALHEDNARLPQRV